MRTSRLTTIISTLLATTALLATAPRAPAHADGGTTTVGDPFPGFSVTERYTPLGGPRTTITSMAVQSTGRIIAAETDDNGVVVLRGLRRDGTPDPSWGQQGSPPTVDHVVSDLKVLSDDRVVVAAGDVRRFTSDGHLDLSFGGGDGRVQVNPGPEHTSPWVKRVVPLADGTLVGAGDMTHASAGDLDVFAVRLLPDGSVDNAYRYDARAYCGGGDCLLDDRAVGALAGSDGSVHVIGTSKQQLSDARPPRAWRLAERAVDDPAPVVLPLPAGWLHGWTIGADTASGFLLGSSPAAHYIARLVLSDSGTVTLDRSWGDDGVVTFGAAGSPTATAVQPDGKLVVATRAGLRRLTRDGRPDPTFQTSPPHDQQAWALAVSDDGGVLHGGGEWDGTQSVDFLRKYVGRLASLRTSVTSTAVAGLQQEATITVHNDGPDSADRVRVTVELDGGFSGTLVPSRGTCTGAISAWRCDVGPVAPGEAASIEAALTAPGPTTGTLVATAATATYDAAPQDQRSSATITASVAAAEVAPALTPAPTPVALQLVKRPAVRGVARPGRLLRATTGTWTVAPSSHRFTWLRDGARIRGAASRSYRLRRTDLGARIAVRVRVATAGASATAKSRAVKVRRAPARMRRVLDLPTKGTLIASPADVAPGRLVLLTGTIGDDVPRRVWLQVRTREGWIRDAWRMPRAGGYFQFSYRAPRVPAELRFRVLAPASRHFGIRASVTPQRRVTVTTGP